MRVNKLNFNTGEISPKLFDRNDLDKHASACELLENFVVTPYGGVVRRPGFEFMGEGGNQTYPIRLIPFNYSTSTAFVIEMGHQYFRFWSNGEQVMGGGSPLQVTSPYDYDQIFEVQFVQINDVVYMVHPDVAPIKLSRVSDTNWTQAAMAAGFPALLSRNTSNVTISASATTGTVTLTASAATFNLNMVGTHVALYHARDDSTVTVSLTADGATSTLRILGSYTIATFGSWGPGLLQLQRYEGGQWVVIRSWESTELNQRNISYSGSSDELMSYRLNYTGSGSSGSRALLEAAESEEYGWAEITGYTNSTTITAVVKDTFLSTDATSDWAIGAWSADQGFPRTIEYHEQRLYFGGTNKQPITIWASKIGDFNYFRYGTNADDGFSVSLSSTEQQLINWMRAQESDLAIGTTSSEWLLSPVEQGSAIGPPANFKVTQASRFGSKYLQAWVANDRLMFVQRVGRKVREFSYAFTTDSWESVDITLLSEHMCGYGDGFKQIEFEQQPDAIVWGINNNNELVGMTYERKQNVYGWHRHTTQGEFESVAIIYGELGDEVWVSVKRTVNSTTKRYIERLDTGYLDAIENEDKNRWFYVDSGVYTDLGDGNESATLTGLGHLEGLSVQILADGCVYPEQVVASGSVTISEPARYWSAGLGYDSPFHPVGIEISQDDGSSQGRKWRMVSLDINFYKSLGGEVQTREGEWDVLSFRDSDDPMDSSPPVFTGLFKVPVAGSYENKLQIAVRQRQPLPMYILSMIPRFQIYAS